MQKLVAATLMAFCLGFGAQAREPASTPEDDYYEAFNPNAAPLALRDPVLPEIEFFSARTNSTERRKIDPSLLEAANGLEFYLFKVGQADAMLVVGPMPERRTLLVDLGVSREPAVSGRYSAELVGQRIIDITGRRRIDYFLLSHFHSDHFGGGDSGITALVAHGGFSVGVMIDTGPLGAEYVSRSPGAIEYVGRQSDWVRTRKVGRVERPRFGTRQIDLGGDVTVDIMAFAGRFSATDRGVHDAYERRHPGYYETNKTSENDLSIALKISLGDFEFWTAGDLSGASGDGTGELSGSNNGYTNVETPMVGRWRAKRIETDVEIYRANHHGSGYSSTPQLLDALDPEVILYSAQSGHRHPTAAAVRRGSATAVSYATGLDSSWRPDDFEKEGGKVVGEVLTR